MNNQPIWICGPPSGQIHLVRLDYEVPHLVGYGDAEESF